MVPLLTTKVCSRRINKKFLISVQILDRDFKALATRGQDDSLRTICDERDTVIKALAQARSNEIAPAVTWYGLGKTRDDPSGATA